MPLVYDADARAYHDDETGDVLDAAAIVRRRDEQIDAWSEELAALVDVELGAGAGVILMEFPAPRINAWFGRFGRRAEEMVTSAYTWARGGVSRMTDADWQTVAGLVERQAGYARGFLDAVKAGDLSAEAIRARAQLYPGAAVPAFERGKAVQHDGLRLPGQPGEGCSGGVQCRCSWEIEERDNEWRCTWHAVGDKTTCETCAGRASDWAPFVQPKEASHGQTE